MKKMISNIEQVFEDYCDGCPYLDIRSETLYSDGSPVVTYISCEKLELCKSLHGRFGEEKMDTVKNDDWIHGPVYDPNSEWNDIFEKVGKALGFDLFIWQKYFITRGEYRRSGKTTAEILRDLLNDVDGEPLDFTSTLNNKIARLYREELLETKQRLDAAGIKTRKVFLRKREKEKWFKDQRLKGEAINQPDNRYKEKKWND